MLVIGALLALIGTVVAAGVQVSGLDAKLATLIQGVQEPTMQTLTTTATNTSGRQATIVTTRNEGETNDDFVARHNALVDAFEAS